MAELDIKWIRLTEVLNEFADRFIQNARDNLQANGSIATGKLYDSFKKIIEIEDNSFKVSISLADYWYYVEHGRGPGKFPPPDVIRNWIEVKPVNISPINGKMPSVEQVGFLIGRKIAENGTQPKPFLEPAKEQTLREFEERIAYAIEEDIGNYILELVEGKLANIL